MPWSNIQLAWRVNQEPELKLSMEMITKEEVVVVRCTGRVVYREEAAALFRKVAEVMPQARYVVLEFSQVEMMDGAGLGELLAILIRARQNNCVLKLAALQRRVRELLEITRLAEVFEIYSSEEEAILASHAQAVS